MTGFDYDVVIIGSDSAGALPRCGRRAAERAAPHVCAAVPLGECTY
jgi:hypothetical protein